MKVIFIGAGMGALTAAERLGKGGVSCTVFEKNTLDNLSYDWHDDVNGAAFSLFGLPMPAEGTYFRKKNWSFIPPSESMAVTVDAPDDALDYSVQRRLLAKQYVKRADKNVEFMFGTKVEKLLLEDDKVVGVRADGTDYFADLVADDSGVFSPFRTQLPEKAMIKDPAPEEVFFAYRAFHKRREDAPDAKFSNIVYLKHLGEKGISWCIQDPSGEVNVLIGRVGKLEKPVLDNALAKLKLSNPTIGDQVMRGGEVYKIPVRYPAAVMVYDGYALIGDSAFMTIPMLGSGMESSMNAGCMLADVVLEKQSARKEDLWEYQLRYYRQYGAAHMGVDKLKRWLLDARPEDISFLFERGIIDERDLEGAAGGGVPKLGIKDIAVKAARGISKLGLLLKLNSALGKSAKAAQAGNRIPQVYNKYAIENWRIKAEKLIK